MFSIYVKCSVVMRQRVTLSKAIWTNLGYSVYMMFLCYMFSIYEKCSVLMRQRVTLSKAIWTHLGYSVYMMLVGHTGHVWLISLKLYITQM